MAPRRYPVRRKRSGFAVLAVLGVGLLVVAAVQRDLVVGVFGVLLLPVAAYLGRDALGPTQAYELREDGFAHVRGSRVRLFIPWDQVTRVSDEAHRATDTNGATTTTRYLGFDVRDRAAVVGTSARWAVRWDFTAPLGGIDDADALVAAVIARARGAG